ncbi:MAG: hypothetical protein L6R43_05430 [Planctomycetes bacterium]|nr:hypothetical protein [Planctomycetota bacterium]
MTLILALQGKDGMVLAADSRSTIGDPRALTAINDDHMKVFRLSDRCGIAISGAAELAARLIDLIVAEVNSGKLVDADPIMAKTVEVARAESARWFGGQRPWFGQGNVQDYRPSIIFILAGYTSDPGGNLIPRTYLLGSNLDFAPQLCVGGMMMAGVPQYAIYLSNRYYNRNMTMPSLTALAAYLISETASQDPKVGGPIRIACLTSNAPFEILPAEKVDVICQRNEAQSKRLREFFFGAGEVPSAATI